MTQRRWLMSSVGAVVAASVVACGGRTSSIAVEPSPNSAAGTVRSFMQAVADSNLAKMASLWGTAKGPAATTREPPDFERRIVVIQSYLRHDRYRVANDVAESDNRHAVSVEIRREACTWLVPFGVIQLTDRSWIVNQIDLTQAGNPARPCQPQADTTAQP